MLLLERPSDNSGPTCTDDERPTCLTDAKINALHLRAPIEADLVLVRALSLARAIPRGADEYVDLTARLAADIARLTKPQRDVLELRVLGGHSHEQTAKKLGRTAEWARATQLRAFKALCPAGVLNHGQHHHNRQWAEAILGGRPSARWRLIYLLHIAMEAEPNPPITRAAKDHARREAATKQKAADAMAQATILRNQQAKAHKPTRTQQDLLELVAEGHVATIKQPISGALSIRITNQRTQGEHGHLGRIATDRVRALEANGWAVEVDTPSRYKRWELTDTGRSALNV